MTEVAGRLDGISPQTAAVSAAVSLLLMVGLAPFAYFVVLGNLVVWDDAGATTSNILASQGLFRASIGAFLIVVLLDVVIAWALYWLLKPVNNALSALVACFRLVYSAAYLTAVAHLFDAADSVAAGGRAALETQVMRSLASFANGWDLALAVFGVHLVLLGWLVYRSGFIPRVIGVLVAIAGLGYWVDSVGKLLVPDYALGLINYTFVGELLLMVWLFWIGFRGVSAGARVGGDASK